MTARPQRGEAAGKRVIPLAAFGFLALYFTGFFPPSTNPNERSRFDMIVAAVERGTFVIDESLRKFGDHEDKAVFGGHFYSNKAPGLAFAGIAVYRVLRLFAGEPSVATAPLLVGVRILTVSLVALLGLARLARRLLQAPFGDEHGAATLAVALGTPFLFYGRSFFSHAWTASLLFLAWDAMKTAEENASSSRSRTMLAGLLAGWAMISEYTVAPIVLLLAGRILAARRLPGLSQFCLGLAPPLALLLIYNRICFGSPWSLSSAHEGFPLYSASARQGFFGIGMPRLRVIGGYLFGSSRGTILFSPFWLWAIAGFLVWWKSGKARRDCVFAGTAVVTFVLILSGYPHWEGGFSLGSRYLLPAIFLAALGLPFSLRGQWSKWMFGAAVSFSVAHFFLLTVSWPYIPPSVPWPAANVAWWSISRHWVAPNLGRSLGLSPLWSLAIPSLVTAGALASATIFQTGNRRAAAAAAVAAGVGLLAVTIILAPAISVGDASWRAWLFQYLHG